MGLAGLLLYYCKFTGILKKRGYKVNPYDSCFWNKDNNGKQCTIVFHVKDCKISHVDPRVNDKTIDWMHAEYEKVVTMTGPVR